MSIDIQSPAFCLGIVGTGAMGRGIAQIAAQAGIRVLLYDALHGAALSARETVVGTLGKLAEKGKITAEALAAASLSLRDKDVVSIQDCSHRTQRHGGRV